MADRLMIERALLNPDGLGAKVLADMEERTACQVLHDWRWWQRPGQVPPPGDWRVWLVMAGRGCGKTRMGAEWVRAAAEADGAQRIALVGASMLEVRRVMVEGESGLLGIAPMATRPRWEPSIGKLSWANGAVAYVYSAADPEGLRGPQHSLAWADEIAKWPRGEGICSRKSSGMALRLAL